MLNWHFVLLIAGLQAATSVATEIVRCEGPIFTAKVIHRLKEVYDVEIRFISSGVTYRVQTNGVIRSDRGFAVRGAQGLVYQKDADGILRGWMAFGPSKVSDGLSCTYLQ